MDTGPGEVRRILEGKLKVALADYGERFRQAQKAASDELASLSARHPDLASELHRLFAAGDYGGMHRLGLHSAFNRPCAALAQLDPYIQNVQPDGIDHRLGIVLGSSLGWDMEDSSEVVGCRPVS